MEKIKDYFLNNKKLCIIIGVLCLVLAVTLLAFGIISNKDEKLKDDTKVTEPNKEKDETQENENVDIPESPANNTEQLLTAMPKVEVLSITNDKIEFSSDIGVEKDELIAVWVYSEPKFLGYFKVILENGKKVIEGLEAALEKIDIEPGSHNIALVKEDGKKIGYIDITIEEGKIQEEQPIVNDEKQPEKEEQSEEEPEKVENKTTTKTIKTTEAINFTTTKENEQNMKKGTSKVVQSGVQGTKEVTYEVTYDSTGKEISRKKLSENITKQPVNQIEKVGTSDFNLNTARLTGATHGFMCTESGLGTEEDGSKYCNDREGQILNEFYAIAIDNVYYATCSNTTGCFGEKVNSFITLTKVSGLLYRGQINGTTYYFEARAGGGDDTPLTQDDCKTFNLSCGTW